MYIRIVLGLVPTFFYFSVKLLKWCSLHYALYPTHNVDSIPKFYTAT